MPHPPRVTVILSSYNHAPYLTDAITSTLTQTFPQFELVVWDDASTDESWAIIESFRDDPRVRMFRNPVNRRDAYRTAIRRYPALGEYVAIHHSDDRWATGKLAQQVDYLDAHTECGAVFTRVEVMTSAGSPLTDATHPYARVFEQHNRSREDWRRDFFFSGNGLCHPSVLLRRQALETVGGYRDGLGQLPDLDLWVRLSRSWDLHILDGRLTSFRVHDDRSNRSGDRPDARRRLTFEGAQVLRHYLAISDPHEMQRTFRDHLPFVVHDQTGIHAALGVMALQSHMHGARAFAHQVLLEVLGTHYGRDLLHRYAAFDHASLVALTGEEL